MVVLGAERFQQRHGLRVGWHALHRTIRHVGGGLALPTQNGHVGTVLHKVADQRVVAPRCCVMERRVGVGVPRVDLRTGLLYQKLDNG